MRKTIQTPFLILCMLLSMVGAELTAQDMHFTLWNQTPLVFNPANTGAFNGTYRVAGIYRDQYRSVSPNAFKTPSISLDSPLAKGFGENDWVGVGLMIYSDRSGSVGLSTSAFKLSGAYHISMGRKQQSVFTLAYQTGSVSRKFKNFIDGAVFEDPQEYNIFLAGGGQSGSNDVGPKSSYTDHVGGIRFATRYNKTDQFTIGGAVSRLGNPDFSLIEGGSGQDSSAQQRGNYRIKPKMVLHSGLSMQTTDQIRIEPSVFFQTVFGAGEYEALAQTEVIYLLNEEKKFSLIGGAGVRFSGEIDAFQLLLGAQADALKVMLSYDVNLSGLSAASNGSGGFELSAVYIGTVYKRPNPDPVIFCPRF